MKFKKFYVFALLLFPLLFSATTIPFEYIDGKIIIDVDIKNKKHNFIFDTGALTIISSELKGSLNEKKSNLVFNAIDANNAKSKMELFSTNDLKLAELKFTNINFSFADISWMDSRACKKISGIFGANMMNNKVWRIDFKTKTIIISDKVIESSARSVSISFSEENFTHVPTINVNIRKQNFNVVFDTGSGSGFTLDSKSYQLVKDSSFLTFEGLLSQSLNSVSKGERELDVMEVGVDNKVLSNQIVDTSSDSRNLVGTRFMENFLIDLDFVNKKVILNPTGKTAEYNSFGIAFAPVENHLIIVNKLKIPQLSELNVADKIIKINNINVSKINAEKFCEVKKLIDNSSEITIQNESGKEFKLEKKNILQYLN
ncbi:aspartyl protease family protein [Chryseobacterium sp. CFBP8996]|uniref:aspartyl protease family protein n=1 Tax=Chryseobacterium sp. CFBP8996 TaxID=3096529 RepID=UPI002A6A0F9C|nr:aspartyl protease family protein [Chryseobacterium sp. CFBP8996]MDY0929693.1 aspartyl protease family protein [Chryseobacterium sp. CFBP8996]